LLQVAITVSGTSGTVQGGEIWQKRDLGQSNALSVRLELQADSFAGVWGHSTSERNLVEQGDVESALKAAAAVGDDRLKRMSTGKSHELITHGSSEQLIHWFQMRLSSGDVQDCDTFAQ